LRKEYIYKEYNILLNKNVNNKLSNIIVRELVYNTVESVELENENNINIENTIESILGNNNKNIFKMNNYTAESIGVVYSNSVCALRILIVNMHKTIIESNNTDIDNVNYDLIESIFDQDNDLIMNESILIEDSELSILHCRKKKIIYVQEGYSSVLPSESLKAGYLFLTYKQDILWNAKDSQFLCKL